MALSVVFLKNDRNCHKPLAPAGIGTTFGSDHRNNYNGLAVQSPRMRRVRIICPENVF